MEYPYQQGYDNAPMVPENHKTMAIAALVLSILCCNVAALALSIYGLMQANEVETCMQRNMPYQAEAAAKNAKLFSIIAFALEGLTFVILVIYFFVVVLAGIAGSY